MINRTGLILGIVGVLAILYLKPILFPTTEDIIRQRLGEVVELVEKSKGENPLQVAGKIKKAFDYFSIPMTIEFASEEFQRTIEVNDDKPLKEALSTVKFNYSWLEIDVRGLKVDLNGSTARTECQFKLTFDSQRYGPTYDLYEVKFDWRKVDGDWKISGVQVRPVIEE